MNTNFLSGMMIFWFLIIIIGIIIFVALIMAIFEMNRNIKDIREYIYKKDLYDENERLRSSYPINENGEHTESWIYE